MLLKELNAKELSDLLYRLYHDKDIYYTQVYDKMEQKKQKKIVSSKIFSMIHNKKDHIEMFKKLGLKRIFYFHDKLVFRIDKGVFIDCCTVKREILTNNTFTVTNY